MPAAFRAWRELEADAGEALYIRTGGASFSPAGVDYAARVAANLRELDVPHWRGSGRAWNERHPVFALPEDYDVVFEPDAGMLRASRAVALEIELARLHGRDQTRVMEQTPVRRIDLEGVKPVVITDSARIVADRLIVSAGGWVKRLLPSLAVPLAVRRTSRCSTCDRSTQPRSASADFPVFIFKGAGPEDAYYGMPEFQGLGVKVARHGGPECDPDARSDDRRGISPRPSGASCDDHIPALAECADRFHRSLSLHRRTRRAIPGRLSARPDRRDRRQPLQRPWIQVFLFSRASSCRPRCQRHHPAADRRMENRRAFPLNSLTRVQNARFVTSSVKVVL